MSQLVRFIHFNDVYNIKEKVREPVGGASRFIGMIHKLQTTISGPKPIVLFSGDAFSPSVESSLSKGKHMVPILNACCVSVACFGNHDFDFGVDELVNLSKKCEFPWLISNVSHQGKPLANGDRYFTLILENGIKMGFVGLVEKEWLDTISFLPKDIVYESFVDVGKELSSMLKEQEHCDVVIALTHMRMPNDILLSENVPEIDMILGGHDHFYKIHRPADAGRPIVLKSGCDFMQLSLVEMEKTDFDAPWEIKIQDFTIDSSVPKQPEIGKHSLPRSIIVETLVEDLTIELESVSKKIIGFTSVQLDVRSSSVRLRESAVGNFTTDVARHYYNTDVALVCGGTLRSDTVYGPGAITLGDILSIYPFEDTTLVLYVTGEQLLAALENGVSQYPKEEGRFPHVSNIKFSFDPSRPPYQRIVSVLVKDEPLDLQRQYTMATRTYMASGRDGYEVLTLSKHLFEPDMGLLFSALMHHFFKALKVVSLNGTKHPETYEEFPFAEVCQKMKEPSSIDGSFSDISGREESVIPICPCNQGRITIV